MKLAAWCEQKGLKAQAIAHYNVAVRLDPSRETAWRHLGYKKHGDRWVKPEEPAADELEAERQRHADKQWRPRLEQMRDGLEGKDPARRAKAEEAIAEVTDPRAVPMIWAVFDLRRQRAIADRRRADARPDRRAVGVNGPGHAGGLQPSTPTSAHGRPRRCVRRDPATSSAG